MSQRRQGDDYRLLLGHGNRFGDAVGDRNQMPGQRVDLGLKSVNAKIEAISPGANMPLETVDPAAEPVAEAAHCHFTSLK